LDSEWTNFDGPDEHTHTPDNFVDDKKLSLLSGNGQAAGNPFELWFSVLPGDYNQDGYLRNFNPGNDVSVAKDGTGDGVVEDDDEALVVNGEMLPLRARDGDYEYVASGFVDNDIVDGEDYGAWRATYGSTVVPGTGADGAADGQINLADYVVWRNKVGLFSAWNPDTQGIAVGLFVVDFDNPPQVIDVIVEGSDSTHAPYSFDGDSFAANLRRVPVGGADTVSIKFSEDVNVEASHLRLVGMYTAHAPTLAEFSYSMATMTATWRYEDPFIADQYAIMLDDAVTDIEGNRLDGEWVNNSSVYGSIAEFPSGNETAGGDFNFLMTILPGDAHPDAFVDETDLNQYLWVYWGMSGAEFGNGDFNGDGTVNMADYDIWEQNNGLNLTSVWIRGDLDGDRDVDQADVDELMDHWNLSGATWAQGDLNGNGVVNEDDLDVMFAQFGLDLEVA
jgi:hypothetical protein